MCIIANFRYKFFVKDNNEEIEGLLIIKIMKEFVMHQIALHLIKSYLNFTRIHFIPKISSQFFSLQNEKVINTTANK